MGKNIDELINSLTHDEIIEFLEKVPVTIDVTTKVTAGFFGKAWGRVKVTLTYKDKVIQHKEQML